MAGNLRFPELTQHGDFDAATLDGVRTALVEGATRGRIQRRRKLAFERDSLAPACSSIALCCIGKSQRRRPQLWRACEQSSRVRMHRPVEHGFLCPLLDD